MYYFKYINITLFHGTKSSKNMDNRIQQIKNRLKKVLLNGLEFKYSLYIYFRSAHKKINSPL